MIFLNSSVSGDKFFSFISQLSFEPAKGLNERITSFRSIRQTGKTVKEKKEMAGCPKSPTAAVKRFVFYDPSLLDP